MKRVKLYIIFSFLLATTLFFSGCKKQELEVEPAKTGEEASTENGSESIDFRSFDPQIWFNQYLIDAHGQEKADELIGFFNPIWDQVIKWNDYTYVIPCDQFINLDGYAYTRLFLSQDEEGGIQSYFFSVIPTKQEQFSVDYEFSEYFNGKLITFDVLYGYLDMMVYENGLAKEYYEREKKVDLRCCTNPWLDIINVDGTGGGGGISPPGSPAHVAWYANWQIHSNVPGSTGGAGGGNGTYGDIYIDIEGLIGAEEQKFINLACSFALTTEYSCNQIVHIINTGCLGADDFDECAQESIDAAKRLGVRMWFINNGLGLQDVNLSDYIDFVTFDENGDSSVDEESISILLLEPYSLTEQQISELDEEDGFFDRTVSCASYDFVYSPSNPEGQSACVSGFYLSRGIDENFEHVYTPEFCLHFTVRRIPWGSPGTIISEGEAATCSSRAMNVAAFAVSGFVAERATPLMSPIVITMIKAKYKEHMTNTDCGYGVATSCTSGTAICPTTPTPVQWNHGFAEYILDQFDCD